MKTKREYQRVGQYIIKIDWRLIYNITNMLGLFGAELFNGMN